MPNRQADDRANDRLLETDYETSASSRRLADRSHQQSLWWRRIWHALLTPAYNPRFPPGPLQRPLVGYLAAILLQLTAGICMLLLVQASPSLRFPGELMLLAIPLTALIWGTGPGTLAAFVGAALLFYLGLNHYFPSTPMGTENVINILLYLIIGLTISLLASQTQNTRYRAALETNRLQRYYEELIALFAAERQARQASEHKLQTRELQLDAVLESATDAVFILDALGASPQMNQAAKDLLDLPADFEPGPALEQLFDLLDAQGDPLPSSLWPRARLLKGERLYPGDTNDLLVRTRMGLTRSVTISGMPVRDEDNTIVGAVLVCSRATDPRVQVNK